MNGSGNSEEELAMRDRAGRHILRLVNDHDHSETSANNRNPVESDAAHLVPKYVEGRIPKFFPILARTLERLEETGTVIKKLLVSHSMRPCSPLAIRT